MKKVKGFVQVSSNDEEIFRQDIEKWVQKLQNDGQELEFHYTTNAVPSNTYPICYNVLIIGRKNED